MWQDRDAPTKPTGSRAETGWVAVLLLLAFLVRWLPALVPHFWFDEMFTIAMARNSFGEILRINAADMHPPLYYSLVKCFAMAGSRLGGPFATLPWLRLASIMPGMLACALGWGVARRYWGRGPALWTLAAFAVSPAQTYYSIDLRCYSSLHALLLGALAGFLRATEPPPGGTRWPAMALFAGCALTAFYTHSLSTLYLAAFGVLLLAELARDGRLRAELAWPGALLALILALGCAPWIRLMFSQLASLNAENWLEWARVWDLISTFFWFMPLGPLDPNILKHAWPWGIMLILALAFLMLINNAWNTGRRPLSLAEGALPRLKDDRLLIHAGLLAVVPVLAAFILSYFHLAKAFLGFRYNLIPAPFITLVLVGLVLRIASRRGRIAALCLLLAIRLAASGFLIRQRITQFDIVGEVARARPEVLRPDCRMVWNNPMVLPWLGQRCGTHRIRSIEDILSGRIPVGSHETLYVLTHFALDDNYSGLLHRRSFLLREIMNRKKIPKESIKGTGAWEAAWRLTAADLPSLSAALDQACGRIEARRHAIKGGQVLLADEENFYITHGWAALQFGPDLFPERWTIGTHPRLTWSGPARPGHYRLRAIFRRRHPYPDEFIELRYRLPGRSGWRSQQAGVGQVVIEGDIFVKTPGERLDFQLDIPPWVPRGETAPSMPDRHLGMVFEALELHPRSRD